MDMFDYYKLAFKRYAEYSGRSTAAEYWYFALCHFLVSAALVILIILGAENNTEALSIAAGISLGLYTLASFIPSLMISIRRLHDTGKSGWFNMFGYIPLIGPILLIIFLAQKSDEDNRWGDKLDLEDQPMERLALPVIEYEYEDEDEFV